MANEQDGYLHDEHGPVAPAPYLCPICRGDKDRFMTCEYPACPDGCDQPSRFRTYPTGSTGSTFGPSVALLGWAVAIALLVWCLWPHSHF